MTHDPIGTFGTAQFGDGSIPAAPRNSRERMIDGAIALIARRGVQSTSFSDITRFTQTSRGSIYHHFPGGKSELVIAAVRRNQELMEDFLAGLPTTSPLVFVTAYTRGWRDYIVNNNFEAGSAPAAIAHSHDSEAELEAVAQLYRDCMDLVRIGFMRSGLSKTDAAHAAALTATTCEGALLCAQAQRSLELFDMTITALHDVIARFPYTER